MDGIAIYNATIHRIFITIYNGSAFPSHRHTPLESGWLEPFSQYKATKGRTPVNYVPGSPYRIQSIIEDSEEKIAFETSVIVYLSAAPIEIKTDNDGIFWWKVFNEKTG